MMYFQIMALVSRARLAQAEREPAPALAML